MPSFITNALLPIIVAPMTFAVMQLLKGASTRVDALPPVGKRMAVAVIALALTVVGGLTGVNFGCDADAAVNCLSTLDKDAVKAAIAAGLAFLLHFGKQQAEKRSK